MGASGRIIYTPGNMDVMLRELCKRATITDLAGGRAYLNDWQVLSGLSGLVTLNSVGVGFVYKNTTITFAPAFAVTPIVLVSLDTFTGASIGWNCNTISNSATSVVVQIIRAGGAITDTVYFNWQASGYKLNS